MSRPNQGKWIEMDKIEADNQNNLKSLICGRTSSLSYGSEVRDVDQSRSFETQGCQMTVFTAPTKLNFISEILVFHQPFIDMCPSANPSQKE
jgi:hypothetical protein